jgi:hypothetical protein
MENLKLTNHAVVRIAQRAIRDVDLIEMIGTQVEDGYFVTNKDCREFERFCKGLIQKAQRIKGALLISRDGYVITTFRPTDRQQRRLLRHGHAVAEDW